MVVSGAIRNMKPHTLTNTQSRKHEKMKVIGDGIRPRRFICFFLVPFEAATTRFVIGHVRRDEINSSQTPFNKQQKRRHQARLRWVEKTPMTRSAIFLCVTHGLGTVVGHIKIGQCTIARSVEVEALDYFGCFTHELSVSLATVEIVSVCVHSVDRIIHHGGSVFCVCCVSFMHGLSGSHDHSLTHWCWSVLSESPP
jgi:hypothetical protein